MTSRMTAPTAHFLSHTTNKEMRVAFLREENAINQESHARPDPSDRPKAPCCRLPVSVYLLCLSAFFMSLKPSEPFLTNYLRDVIGLTDEQVNDEVYPVWTYSFLAFLLPAGVMAHLVGTRSVVLLGFAGRVVTRFVLLSGSGVPLMQLMQVAFGLASACEPIMYALVYKSVPRKHFLACTAWMQSSALVGHLIAGLSGQAMVDSGISLRVLFVISTVSVCLATIIFMASSLVHDLSSRRVHDPLSDESAAPRVATNSQDAIPLRSSESILADTATLFGEKKNNNGDNATSWVAIVRDQGCKSLFHALVDVYSHPRVRFWSVWWITSRGTLELVLNYNTTLFYELAPTVDHDGLVVAVGRGAASIAAMTPSWTGLGNDVDGVRASALLVSVTAFSSTLLFLSAAWSSLNAAYTLFVLFYAAMQFLTSISSSIIAEHIPSHQGRVLVWTFNTFLSLVIQAVTQTILGHHVLHASGPSKFYVLATQLAAVVMGFVGWIVVRQCRTRRRRRSTDLSHISDSNRLDFTHLEA